MRKLTPDEKAEIRRRFPHCNFLRVSHFFASCTRYKVETREQVLRNVALTAAGVWCSDTTDAALFGVDLIFPEK